MLCFVHTYNDVICGVSLSDNKMDFCNTFVANLWRIFLAFQTPNKAVNVATKCRYFSEKVWRCPRLDIFLLIYIPIQYTFTLTVRRMVRKPSQKIVRKIGQIIAIFFRRIDSHPRLLRPSLFLRNHECVHTWMQKDVGFYAFAAANQQVAGGVKIVREA